MLRRVTFKGPTLGWLKAVRAGPIRADTRRGESPLEIMEIPSADGWHPATVRRYTLQAGPSEREDDIG